MAVSVVLAMMAGVVKVEAVAMTVVADGRGLWRSWLWQS